MTGPDQAALGGWRAVIARGRVDLFAGAGGFHVMAVRAEVEQDPTRKGPTQQAISR